MSSGGITLKVRGNAAKRLTLCFGAHVRKEKGLGTIQGYRFSGNQWHKISNNLVFRDTHNISVKVEGDIKIRHRAMRKPATCCHTMRTVRTYVAFLAVCHISHGYFCLFICRSTSLKLAIQVKLNLRTPSLEMSYLARVGDREIAHIDKNVS